MATEPTTPSNWIAGARLSVIQHRLRTGAETLTKETAQEINTLQKLAFPTRTRANRRRLTATLNFAPKPAKR